MDTSATARLLADVVSEEILQGGSDGLATIVVVDDNRGLADTVLARFRPDRLVVHCDRLSAERELRARLGDHSPLTTAPNTELIIAPVLNAEIFAGADAVLIDLPASRSALDEIARLAAAARCPVLLGVGRDRHMNQTMNATLARSFRSVRASRGRQKSRVLIASGPRADAPPTAGYPRRRRAADGDLEICAFGGAFAGTRIDAGTRLLLGTRPRWPDAEQVVDLGCGTGVLAAIAARVSPQVQVRALDESAAACRSTQATAAANGLSGAIAVQRTDGLDDQAEDSADLVLCNPPFHIGTAKESTPAVRMLADARRVLRPGGELWVVHNSHLPYRGLLRAEVGPTEVITQDRHYLVLRARRE